MADAGYATRAGYIELFSYVYSIEVWLKNLSTLLQVFLYKVILILIKIEIKYNF